MATSHKGVTSIATVPAAVEDLLKQTMVFGLPEANADKPTFYFERQVTWTKHDSADKPWVWTTAPSLDTTPDPTMPICAYEFFAPLGRSGAQFSEVGDFFPSTVIVTFVGDTDFNLAVNSSYVTIGPGQTKWYFRYWKPEVSLGTIPVQQAHFQAEDTV
jgi:hypothetical protein